MKEIREEINEETYNKYARMSYKDRCDEIRPTIPDEWLFGYGYYGHYLSKNAKGKFYVVHRIGNSCD